MIIASSTRPLFQRSFMQRAATLLSCVCALGAVGCGDEEDDQLTVAGNQPGGASLSFFVTSTTHDGNLGGLTGADQICDDLATAVGAGNRTWRAYLSAAGNGTPVHARSRIGNGPWVNADGVTVAENLQGLHMLTGDPQLFIDENGEPINGQWNGVMPNQHDIMTGSDSSGMLIMTMDPMTNMPAQTTCNDWTSNAVTPGPQVGHTDGMGPMMSTAEARFTSWNGGHPARGCSTELLAMSGGAGRFYCFAAN